MPRSRFRTLDLKKVPHARIQNFYSLLWFLSEKDGNASNFLYYSCKFLDGHLLFSKEKALCLRFVQKPRVSFRHVTDKGFTLYYSGYFTICLIYKLTSFKFWHGEGFKIKVHVVDYFKLCSYIFESYKEKSQGIFFAP